jgi:acyl-ACP thioesterase
MPAASLRAVQLTELVAPPTEGRVFTDRARAGLGDVAPSGRVRLDTIARWLQDAAFADLLDSGVPDDGVWIVRRLRLRVERFPRMHESVSVATWCSGAGSLVAERRSTVRGDEGGLVEAVALWVHLDPVGLRPRPMPEGFEAVYGPSAAGRRARAAAPPRRAALRRRVRFVALPGRRPRPRRPCQQRGVLAGARGGSRRRRRR